MQITAEEMAVYRETAQRIWAQERQELIHRRQRAWMVARQAAILLRERFGANRVVVFGSLVREDLFHPQSDVDLAVWGVDETRYYRVVAQLLALDPMFEVDLVMGEEAPIALRETIEREGIAI